MRIRSTGLALFAGLTIIVSACGGATADIKKVGLVTDVGTLEDKSFNEASWLGAQDGAKTIGGTANNIVTKAPADYAANIKTFVDQGYEIIVTVGFAMGDATTIAAKTYPNVKFIGVDQGVCVDETGKSDPTFACKGDPTKLLPNYQGLVYKEEQVGYLAGVLAASVSKSGVVRHGRRHQHDPGGRPLHQRLPQRSHVGEARWTRSSCSTFRPTSPRRFNDPGTGKSIAQQMLGQKADVIFQVAGLSGAGALEAACATPGVAGIGVDVDQSKSLPNLAKCILTSAEKSLVGHGLGGDQEGRRQDGQGRNGLVRRLEHPAWRRPRAVRRRLRQPRHPRDPGGDRQGLRRSEGRHGRSLQADPLRQEGLGRLSDDADNRTGRHRVGPFRLLTQAFQHRERDGRRPRRPILEMRGISKRYPGVVANDGIDLDLRPGEIHALLGENGAGKSTLMNILYGLAAPDEGEILIDGQPVEILGPHDAIGRGIGMVHQHFMLVPVLTVAENILLGEETMANAIFLDRDEAAPPDRRARPAVRLRDRPRRPGREPVGRLAAAGRDPQGALSKRPHPRPRRADGGPDSRRRPRRSSPSSAASPRRATGSSSSATSSTRSWRSPTGSR